MTVTLFKAPLCDFPSLFAPALTHSVGNFVHVQLWICRSRGAQQDAKPLFWWRQGDASVNQRALCASSLSWDYLWALFPSNCRQSPRHKDHKTTDTTVKHTHVHDPSTATRNIMGENEKRPVMNNINGLWFCFWLKRALIFLQDQSGIVGLGQGTIVIIVAKRPAPNSCKKVTY